MESIILHLCTKADARAALHHIRSRVLNPQDVRAIVLSESRALPASESVDEELLADILVECTQLQRLDLDSWAFESLSAANIQRAAAGALSSIQELVIGPRGSLGSASFFLMLSAMPSLRFLEFNSILDSPTQSPGSDEGSGSFPTPACSLTSVVVVDDWGFDFKHYGLLFRHSHDTLKHLELHWVFDEDVGPVLAEALAPCRNLRSLVLIGSQFDYPDVISRCPRLRCLTLINPPTEGEMSAIQAPLRELRLIHCTPAETQAGIIPDHLPLLRTVLLRLPALDTLRVVSKSVQIDESYHQLRMLCAKQRLHFTTSLQDYDWVM